MCFLPRPAPMKTSTSLKWCIKNKTFFSELCTCMQPIFFLSPTVSSKELREKCLSLTFLDQHRASANLAGGPECHKTEREPHISHNCQATERCWRITACPAGALSEDKDWTRGCVFVTTKCVALLSPWNTWTWNVSPLIEKHLHIYT